MNILNNNSHYESDYNVYRNELAYLYWWFKATYLAKDLNSKYNTNHSYENYMMVVNSRIDKLTI